jgi:hypothetical protein
MDLNSIKLQTQSLIVPFQEKHKKNRFKEEITHNKNKVIWINILKQST